MSEYWKSTPNYWCKYCKTFVRDTKFEKQKHEATPRHQGQIQRSLRTLHRDTEREEREKQRAKNEVARLNGIVTGNAVAASSKTPTIKKDAPQQASADERKRQIAQLAAMGVAVPEGYRRENALAGDWQTVSQSQASQQQQQDVKPDPDAVSFGVRKRKLEDGEEEDDAAAEQRTGPVVANQSWGSRFKSYRNDEDEDVDFGSLMGAAPKMSVKREEAADGADAVKKEESPVDVKPDPDAKVKTEEAPAADQQEEPLAAPVVFKKRKNKALKAG